MKHIRHIMHQLLGYIFTYKMKLPIIIGAFAFPFFETIQKYFNKYIFDDYEFLGFLAVFIFLDTVFGFIKYWKLGQISSDGWGAIVAKLLAYGGLLMVFHGLSNFSQKEAVRVAFDWVNTVAYAAILVREAISIIENISIIKPNLLPAWILKKLKNYDATGDFNTPQIHNNETNQPTVDVADGTAAGGQ